MNVLYPRPPRRPIRIAPPLAAAMIALPLVSGCSLAEGALARLRSRPAAPAAAETQATAVEAQRLEPRPLEAFIMVNGEIRPELSVEAYPEAAGTLVSLSVRRGDRVAKGQVIAELDPSRPGQRFALSQVRAPIDGTVVSVSGRVGAQALPQAPVAVIATVDRLEIVAQVPERRAGALSLGARATVRLDALPGFEPTARLTLISPTVDPQSRSLEAVFSFERGDARLRPGMFAQLRIVTERRAAALAAPQHAVMRRGDETWVYVVADGRAERRDVRLGLELDGLAELRSGVAPGELVIVRGQNLVGPGAAVRVVGGAE